MNDLDPRFTATVFGDSVRFRWNDTIKREFATYNWSFGDSKVKRWDSLPHEKEFFHKYPQKDSGYIVFFLIRSVCFSAYSSKTVFIPDSAAANATLLFPNPATGDRVQFISERKKEITKLLLLNSMGQSVANYSVDETIKGYDIVIHDLPAGVYYLRVHYQDKEIRHYKILRAG